MSFEVWPDLDPQELLDYGFEWADRLDDGDTIASSSWEVAAGSVTIANSPAPSIAGTITRLWLSGGTLNETCEVTNHVTTSAGRLRDRTAKLKIKAK